MASQQEILAGLAELINEETGISADDVQPGKTFVEDLEIDSLSMMTIVVNAQDRFEVEIPDDAIGNLKTVQDAVDYIAAATATVSQG